MHYNSENKSMKFWQKNGRYLFFVLIILVFFVFLVWGLAEIQLSTPDEHNASVDNNK
ncbi:MAG: hypothetical protein GX786_05525 [Clostridiales bacterium]|nr:hypothetical protein [Clostridiales bacterium]